MLTYFVQSFSGPAGPFMYALLCLLAVSIAVMIDRAVTLARFRCDADALLAKVLPAASKGESVALGATPLEQVAAAGLAHRDPETAFDAMSAVAVDAELRIRRRVAYLSTVASVSTMVGLVGTVYGLILAFGAVGTVSAAERAARLSEGSATAMATTAFGLIVAIPSLIAYAVADSAARDLTGRMEQVASRILVALRSGRA